MRSHFQQRFVTTAHGSPTATIAAMGMGQVTLGLRSLAIKLAVFFVLAALLAWALGGTLWPRPVTADMQDVEFAGQIWFWRLSVGGDRPGVARWTLMRSESGSNRAREVDSRQWVDVAGAVAADGRLCYGGLVEDGDARRWQLECRDSNGQTTTHPMPDRLALEQQLSRMLVGLPIQDAATIAAQRGAVLDPSPPGPSRGTQPSAPESRVP